MGAVAEERVDTAKTDDGLGTTVAGSVGAEVHTPMIEVVARMHAGVGDTRTSTPDDTTTAVVTAMRAAMAATAMDAGTLPSCMSKTAFERSSARW